MKKLFLTFTLLSLSTFAHAAYTTVNGMKMYYEIHGKGGTPLVMIHGGGSTLDSYAYFIPYFAKHRQVIALEEQGHGRTEGRTTQETFTQTADDVAELIKSLKIKKADILGFSNGASSAMQLTIRHPELVRKLVFASAFTKKSGAMPGFFEGFNNNKKCMMPEELKKAFLKVNPSEEKLMDMCMQDTARMKNFIETSDEDVKKIKVPVLILSGDQDVVTVDHSVELSKLIKGSRLVILPGGHGAFFGEFFDKTGKKSSPEVSAKIVEEFLSL